MLNVSLIQTNGSPKTIRDAIVSLLSEEWPLSAKQILNRGRKEFGFSVSSQAVYKALKQLENESIIRKNGEGYLLDFQWIKKTRQIVEELHQTYSLYNENNHDRQNSFSVSTLHEADKFLLNLILRQQPTNTKESPLIMHWSHYWVPLLLSLNDYKKIKDEFIRFEVFGLVRGNTLIDRWCQDFWTKAGVQSKCGIDVASTCDLLVYGDTVIQIFYPEEIKKNLEEFFSTVTKIEDLDLYALFEGVFQKKTNIQILVHKNPALAQQLTSQTIKIFEKQ